MKYIQRKKKIIINEKVRDKIVKQPLEVQVLFWKLMPVYDSDIDPFHRPSWVEKQKIAKEMLLQHAIEEAGQFATTINSWYIDVELDSPPSYLEVVNAFIDLTDGDFTILMKYLDKPDMIVKNLKRY